MPAHAAAAAHALKLRCTTRVFGRGEAERPVSSLAAVAAAAIAFRGRRLGASAVGHLARVSTGVKEERQRNEDW